MRTVGHVRVDGAQVKEEGFVGVFGRPCDAVSGDIIAVNAPAFAKIIDIVVPPLGEAAVFGDIAVGDMDGGLIAEVLNRLGKEVVSGVQNTLADQAILDGILAGKKRGVTGA